MDRFKKILVRLLFPHTAIIILVAALASVLLAVAFAVFGGAHVFSYISYALSAYALTVVCVRIPDIIRFIKSTKENNPLIKRLSTDFIYRIKLSLYLSLAFGVAYASLQAGLAVWHRSVWFATVAGYYLLLVIIRLFLLHNFDGGDKSADPKKELVKFCLTGILLLLMNIALGGMVFYIVRLGYGFRHHEITTIALAAYTFSAVSVSVVNNVRYRKYKRPVFSAVKIADLASALVSLLTLETAMLSSFGDGDEGFRMIITAITGATVCIFILTAAILMIINSTKKLMLLKEKENDKPKEG